MEQLDDLARERNQLVSRAQRLADADDISARIQKEAAGLESWAEVQPFMFEDTLDQELVKYDKFRHDIEEGAVKQSELLENVKESHPQLIASDVIIISFQTRMDSFLHSRQEDDSVKEREYALQSLDLSYHKYKEIVRHLDDGMQVRIRFTLLHLAPEQPPQQFYNDLAAMLIKFKESCLEWVMGRRSEIR